MRDGEQVNASSPIRPLPILNRVFDGDRARLDVLIRHYVAMTWSVLVLRILPTRGSERSNPSRAREGLPPRGNAKCPNNWSSGTEYRQHGSFPFFGPPSCLRSSRVPYLRT